MEKSCKGWENLDAADFRDIDPGDRLLMGPGPSDVPARTLQAIAAPCIGHLDPYFLATMNERQRTTEGMRDALPQQSQRARIAVIVFMVWIGLAQLAPLYLGWELVSEQRERQHGDE